MKKIFFPTVLLLFAVVCLVYLAIQFNHTFQEYKHWKSRESVLNKELEVLREEAREHQEFLNRLRRNPDFQDDVAKKELGYGKLDEWLYRFSEENKK